MSKTYFKTWLKNYIKIILIIGIGKEKMCLSFKKEEIETIRPSSLQTLILNNFGYRLELRTPLSFKRGWIFWVFNFSQCVPIKFTRSTWFPWNSPKMFSIALHFYFTYFAQSCYVFTPSSNRNFYFGESLQSVNNFYFYFWLMGQLKWLVARKNSWTWGTPPLINTKMNNPRFHKRKNPRPLSCTVSIVFFLG